MNDLLSLLILVSPCMDVNNSNTVFIAFRDDIISGNSLWESFDTENTNKPLTEVPANLESSG